MRRTAVAVLCGLAGFGIVADARSEPFPTRAERIASPGRSAAGEDSAEALVLNPANLANLPGREIRWTGVRCPDTRRVACGHAFDLATPLFFGLSTGLRVDYVQPPGGPDGAGFPYDGVDYSWVTWGLGYKISDRLSVGATMQWSYSSNPYTDGLFGISAGVSWRPNTHFGFAAIAQDFNGPSTQLLPPMFVPVLDRTFVGAMAFRPLGTRAVEIGAELRYFDVVDQARPRATIGVDVPGVGRARGDFEVQNIGSDSTRGVVGSAGLEIAFAGFSAGGGALFGSGLGTTQSVAEYATASYTSYINPGVPRIERAVAIRVESTPGPRTHVHMLERLWQLSLDKEIVAVTMVMRAEPADTFAHAEELADAFRVLRARGKKVVCSWEDAGPKAVYACASADRIVLNPAGHVSYAGLKSTHIYLAGLLQKLGVKAEIVRIGAHKSAPEQFTNEHASDVARADAEDLLRQNEAVFVRNQSLYRHQTEQYVRETTAKGPFFATDARAYRWVDGLAFDDEIERVTQEVVGRKVSYAKYEDERRAPETFGPRGTVGLLYVDGAIVDGRSSTIPLIDMKLVGSYTIVESIQKLRDDGDVKAVVLRIDSPGGSSMASDVIWRELKMLAAKKPLIVSMGSVAGSGGYYIAAPARRIYALPLTLTGSIGVFYGKADASELLKKIGVNADTIKTNARADETSPFRGFTDDERAAVMRDVRFIYDTFVDRVAEGRRLDKAQVDAVGQGRVWTGQQALERKLVDQMGGIRHALEEARRLGGLPDDAPIVEAPPIQKTLLDRALELTGMHATSPLSIEGLPVSVREVARAIAPLAVYSGKAPLTLMEWVPLEEGAGTDEE